MVYESDFYTTRRPYARPTVSSYSVTRREVPWHKVPLVPRPSQVAPCFTVFGSRSVPNGVKLPGLGKGQTFHHHIPAVAHKRLVVISPSAHTHTRSRPSVLLGEIDRIYHKVRPCLAYQPTEDYLNSRSMVSFDDETRSIRAKTADLLRKIHTPVPRAQRPMPLPGDAYYSHSELPITDRISNDNYINRLLSGNRDVARDINIMSHYEEPCKRYSSIGRGHLACVSFAGGHPISKRRNLAHDDYIKDNINYLSHSGRFRAAAAAAATPPTEPEYEPSTHRPPSKSSVTGSWKSNAPRTPKEPVKAGHLTAGEEYDAAQDRKQRRRDAVEAAAQRECDEEKRRKQELTRQDDLAGQALADQEREAENKVREEEQAAKRREEEAQAAAEQQAKDEEERLIREEEERLAAEELKLIEEEEAKKRQEEDEKKAKKAKKEADKKAKEEAEKKAKEEEERKAKEEADRKAKEEDEQRAKEEAERQAKEEAERLAKEEADKLAKEIAEKQAQEEAERLAKEEAERQTKEEADRLEAEEAARAAESASAEEAAPVEEAAPEAPAAAAEEPAVPAEEPAAEEPVVEEPVEEAEPAAQTTTTAEEVSEEEEEE